ncbi:hypothetical protein B0F90DRAFT_1859070 [Multifurca ochricompacta]|uniref:Uncharacterized protein n=1 Tax=Multifurca ochricompacta TaxID=376703 RepID=A0AAD4LUL7_9AGAM|nr:hypothetical protein B0F90DRAFT_1859070 [Multifurca ochricompacta]
MFTLGHTLRLGIPQHLRYHTPVTATNLQVQKQHSSALEQEGSLSITLDSYPLKTPRKAFTLALLEMPLHNTYCDSGKTNSASIRITQIHFLTNSDFSDAFNNSKRHVSKTNCFKVIHQSSKSSSTTTLSPSAPFLVAQVEVTSQIERWGEVEDGAYTCHFVCPQNLTSNTQLMTLITMMYDSTLTIQPVYWLQSRWHTQIPLSTSASSSRYSGNVPSSNAQNTAVCMPACRARYHDDITGVQQNRDWCDVACEATNKKDSGIAEAVDRTLVNMRGDEKSEAYEIETSGKVAQSLEQLTWPIRVPASGSTSTKCRLSNT